MNQKSTWGLFFFFNHTRGKNVSRSATRSQDFPAKKEIWELEVISAPNWSEKSITPSGGAEHLQVMRWASSIHDSFYGLDPDFWDRHWSGIAGLAPPDQETSNLLHTCPESIWAFIWGSRSPKPNQCKSWLNFSKKSPSFFMESSQPFLELKWTPNQLCISVYCPSHCQTTRKQLTEKGSPWTTSSFGFLVRNILSVLPLSSKSGFGPNKVQPIQLITLRISTRTLLL